MIPTTTLTPAWLIYGGRPTDLDLEALKATAILRIIRCEAGRTEVLYESVVQPRHRVAVEQQ